MSFYKNEIESSECDLIDKVYVFHPSDLLAEEDWTDFNISFSKSDKSSIEKMIQLSDVEIGVQFLGREFPFSMAGTS